MSSVIYMPVILTILAGNAGPDPRLNILYGTTEQECGKWQAEQKAKAPEAFDTIANKRIVLQMFLCERIDTDTLDFVKSTGLQALKDAEGK